MKKHSIGTACSAFFDTQEEFIRIKVQLERFLAPVLLEVGLTPIQVSVLNMIRKKEKMTVSELVRRLDFNQGNMSSLCKKLEAEGFIRKIRSEDDERKTLMSITQKGYDALARLGDALSFETENCWLTKEEIKKAEAALLTLRGIANKVNTMFSQQNTDDDNGGNNA